MSRLRAWNPARGLLVRQVRSVFNDRTAGERPVVPSDEALFAPDTPIRLVHADVVAMMIGGMRALLMQALHPAALQGVLDHSDFRRDVQGRLRRTARFLAITTYGHRRQAIAAIDRVNVIHARVRGPLPNGGTYSATEPRVLAWVHLAEASSFLRAYTIYGAPVLSSTQQDEYFAQTANVAALLGADPVPRSRADASALLREMRGELAATSAARETARFLLHGDAIRHIGWPEKALWGAAVDLLPAFARTMLQLKPPGIAAAPAVLGAQFMARSVRWAFTGN